MVRVVLTVEPVVHAPVSILRVPGHGTEDGFHLPAVQVGAAGAGVNPRGVQPEVPVLPADALLAHLRAVDEPVQQVVVGAVLRHAVAGEIQVILPLHLQAAVQSVGKPHVGIGMGYFLVRAAVCFRGGRCCCQGIVLIVDNGLMQRPHLFNQRVVLTGSQVVIAVGGVDLQGLDAVQRRDPAHHAEQVALHGAAQGRAAQRHRQHPLPGGLEHPGRFRQQHGRGIVAHSAAHDHAQDHGQNGKVQAILEALPEQGVQQPSAQNGGVGGAAVPEHRLHPAHGHHVPGALAAATAVHEPCQHHQHHAHGGVHGDEPAVFQRHGGRHTGLIPLTAQSIRHPLGLVGAVGRDLLHEVYHGAEPLHGAGIAAVNAEAEALGQQVHGEVRQHRQEVEQGVQGRQHEDVAHNESAEGGQAEEENALACNTQNRHQHPHRLKAAVQEGYQHNQHTGDGIGNGHHDQAGEQVGEEQALPPDGQGVHQPHAAGVVKVAPHRHGAQNGVHDGNNRHPVGQHSVISLSGLQRRPKLEPVVQQVHQHGQGEHGPAEGGQAPQRPVPGQIFLKKGAVKARCL